MYQRGKLWYADYYDATGHRVRKVYSLPQRQTISENKHSPPKPGGLLKNLKLNGHFVIGVPGSVVPVAPGVL
jgi:hypothetical protein